MNEPSSTPPCLQLSTQYDGLLWMWLRIRIVECCACLSVENSQCACWHVPKKWCRESVRSEEITLSPSCLGSSTRGAKTTTRKCRLRWCISCCAFCTTSLESMRNSLDGSERS